MLPVLAPAKMLAAAVVVGAGLVPCGLVAAFRAFSDSPASCRYTSALETSQAFPSGMNPMNEVSLQETLDKLGYTVNVPAAYGGHRLLRWNEYRHSTGDDALHITNFAIGSAARFTKVSEQGMLAGSTEFGVVDARGRRTAVFSPDHNANPCWISADTGAACSWPSSPATRFYINDTSHMLPVGVLSSAPQANADHAPHLLALPARVGGQWVAESGSTGHWEGGKDTGATLLCWEDWQDFDYQDLVILACDVTPNDAGLKAAEGEIRSLSRY